MGQFIKKIHNNLNIYAPNIGVPKYIKQILAELKEINSNTIILVEFNTPNQKW